MAHVRAPGLSPGLRGMTELKARAGGGGQEAAAVPRSASLRVALTYRPLGFVDKLRQQRQGL
jgi:hypothetical protein